MTGIIVGLIVAVFVFRYVHRNKTLYTEYDEMQRQIRGEGYKYAFYTVLILEAVLCVLTMGMELPAEQHVIHFFVIFVGVTVQASYCIWKGAYIGQNTNLPRYIIIMAAATKRHGHPALRKITTSLIPIRKERPLRRCSAIRETINLKKATD